MLGLWGSGSWMGWPRITLSTYFGRFKGRRESIREKQPIIHSNMATPQRRELQISNRKCMSRLF